MNKKNVRISALCSEGKNPDNFCFQWLKKALVDFEERLGPMFPSDWEMSERIAVEFCQITRKDLEKAMFKRQREIDTKLLLHGVQKTYNFEALLSRRYV